MWTQLRLSLSLSLSPYIFFLLFLLFLLKKWQFCTLPFLCCCILWLNNRTIQDVLQRRVVVRLGYYEYFMKKYCIYTRTHTHSHRNVPVHYRYIHYSSIQRSSQSILYIYIYFAFTTSSLFFGTEWHRHRVLYACK